MTATQTISAIQSIARGMSGNSDDVEPIPMDAFVPFRQHASKRKDEMLAAIDSLEAMRGI